MLNPSPPLSPRNPRMVFLLKNKQKSSSINTSGLLGNFEESLLNGRLPPVNVVEGFSANIVASSSSFCSKHINLPVTVFFYTLHDSDNKETSPYLGYVNLHKIRYRVPRNGLLQLALFNPSGTVVHIFLVPYDLTDMPPNSRTFLRQRTYFMPNNVLPNDPSIRKWLRYLIHVRFETSKSGRLYLHTDLRLIIFRKSDLDSVANNGPKATFELRSFTEGPINPQYSLRS